MNDRNDGKSFESLVESIFKSLNSKYEHVSISRDVRLPSLDGPRQFDVVIKIKIALIELITVIECKDYKEKIGIETLDALISKTQDLNISKAILISRNGFSSVLINKANRHNISLFTLDNVSNIDDINLKIPLIFKLITPHAYQFGFPPLIGNLSNEILESIKQKKFLINEINLVELIDAKWNNNTIVFEDLEGYQEIDLPEIKPPYDLIFYSDTYDNEAVLEVPIFKVQFQLKTGYIAIYLDELDGKLLKEIEGQKSQTIYFSVADDNQRLYEIIKLKPKINTPIKYPDEALVLLVLPNLKDSLIHFTVNLKLHNLHQPPCANQNPVKQNGSHLLRSCFRFSSMRNRSRS